MSVNVFMLLPILVTLMVGIGFLQVYLSKREGNVPGLIIPGVFFLISLLWPLTEYADADTVEKLFVLLLANIPTYIYLAIYFVCREKYQKKNQMDKMNIQDLG